MNKPSSAALLLTGAVATGLTTMAAADQTNQRQLFERGRYVVATAACNDCHTPGYPQSGGMLPQADWLIGNPVGISGQWGTTYSAILRLLVQSVTDDQWLRKARCDMRPPMPWFSLREMNDAELRAVYHFIHSLGAKGEPAPAYAPPGQQVNTPYFDFVPKNLPAQASR